MNNYLLINKNTYSSFEIKPTNNFEKLTITEKTTTSTCCRIIVLDRPSSQLSYLDHFLKETGGTSDRTGGISSSSGDGCREASIGKTSQVGYVNSTVAPDKVSINIIFNLIDIY